MKNLCSYSLVLALLGISIQAQVPRSLIRNITEHDHAKKVTITIEGQDEDNKQISQSVTLLAGKHQCAEIPSKLTKITVSSFPNKEDASTHDATLTFESPEKLSPFKEFGLWRVTFDEINKLQVWSDPLIKNIEGYYCDNADVRIIRSDAKKDVELIFHREAQDAKGNVIYPTIKRVNIEHQKGSNSDAVCVLLPNSDVAKISWTIEGTSYSTTDVAIIKRYYYIIDYSSENKDSTLRGLRTPDINLTNQINSICQVSSQ